MTIIKRVVDALRAAGEAELADELHHTLTNIKSSFEQLCALQTTRDKIVRELIYTMQSRCPHYEWYLLSTNVESNPATWGPEDTIACYGCGHTVCDEDAYKFGKRVLRGDYFVYSRAGGRRFCLNSTIKRRLGDKLVVKEIGHGDDQEGLREAGDSAGVGASTTQSGTAAGVLAGDPESTG